MLHIGLGAFIGAEAAWVVDLAGCGALQQLRINPQLHAWGWHGGVAIGLYCLLTMQLLHRWRSEVGNGGIVGACGNSVVLVVPGKVRLAWLGGLVPFVHKSELSHIALPEEEDDYEKEGEEEMSSKTMVTSQPLSLLISSDTTTASASPSIRARSRDGSTAATSTGTRTGTGTASVTAQRAQQSLRKRRLSDSERLQPKAHGKRATTAGSTRANGGGSRR